MAERKTITFNDLDVDAQAELVKDIKKNVASLKLSIDQILIDMDSIRNAKLEIIQKVGSVKDENIVNNAQLQVTLVKAKRIMKKSEENRKKLELVLKKINDFNVIQTVTNATVDPNDLINGNSIQVTTDKNKNKYKKALVNINSGQEKIRLRLLDNNKYVVTPIELPDGKEELHKDKSDFKWGKDSAIKELQWIVKMKFYKLKHHYDKLPYDHDLEERMPLPISWGRSTSDHT